MARKKKDRKSEFVGIPFDPLMKRRLEKLAANKKTKPTPLARDYVVEGIERDEKMVAAAK